MTFDQFIAMPVTDRFLASESLNELIEQSNEQGGDRPKDYR